MSRLPIIVIAHLLVLGGVLSFNPPGPSPVPPAGPKAPTPATTSGDLLYPAGFAAIDSSGPGSVKNQLGGNIVTSQPSGAGGSRPQVTVPGGTDDDLLGDGHTSHHISPGSGGYGDDLDDYEDDEGEDYEDESGLN